MMIQFFFALQTYIKNQKVFLIGIYLALFHFVYDSYRIKTLL